MEDKTKEESPAPEVKWQTMETKTPTMMFMENIAKKQMDRQALLEALSGTENRPAKIVDNPFIKVDPRKRKRPN